jgi:hypothetical protein
MNYSTVKNREEVKLWLEENTKKVNTDYVFTIDNDVWKGLYSTKIGFSKLVIFKNEETNELACHTFEHNIEDNTFPTIGKFDNYNNMIEHLTNMYTSLWKLN